MDSNDEEDVVLNVESTNDSESTSGIVAEMNLKLDQLEALFSKQRDPETEQKALNELAKLQNPIHGVITSWEDWYMSSNAFGSKSGWQPDKNMAQKVRSEVTDVYKAMSRIR
mmetsp:Transcript_17344/g.26741  ORF Transcript_17344/g.26741 Transcript_17344/m.26741 type:complete len:112 (-) Transcript_17344:211-546(-)